MISSPLSLRRGDPIDVQPPWRGDGAVMPRAALRQSALRNKEPRDAVRQSALRNKENERCEKRQLMNAKQEFPNDSQKTINTQ